jgi:tight adherence protein B
MLIIFLFLGIFVTVALLLFGLTAGKTNEARRTIARLDAIGANLHLPLEDEPFVVRRQDMLSAVPWLDRLLRRMDLAPKVRPLLNQADLMWTPGRLLLTSALAGMICGYLVHLRTGSVFLALFMTGVAGSSPFLYVLRKRNQRFDRMKQRLPEALDLMVAAIRAGHSFSSAMSMAARDSQEPVRREFRQTVEEQNFGLDLRVAMTNLAFRVPTREIRMIVTAVMIQKETGGNLTEILEKVTQLIREDFHLQRQVRVHTAQGRLTGWILSILPAVLGIGLYLVNPEQMSLLWTRPIGLKALYGSLVMTTIGGLIIRKIVQIQI